MEITQQEYDLIDKLLEHDLRAFAHKLNLIDDNNIEIEDSFAAKLINLAEKISRRSTDTSDRNACLLICALLWEHRQDRWMALSSHLIKILNKLGLPPSAQMVDLEYDKENQLHSPLGSFTSELKVNKNIQEHEVPIGDAGTLILSDFQKEMWDLISGNFPRVGISAPTSAGKSFVLVAKIIDFSISKPTDVFFIVPTITLINQVSKDIRMLARKYCISKIRVLQSFEKSIKDRGISSIYVMTQERALSAVKSNELSEGCIDVLVVDEVQNIERVSNEGDERSKDLYNLIHILENDIRPELAIISGPRLSNIDSIASNLFNSPSVSLKADLPPVINLTYSFSNKGDSVVLNQYYSENDYPQTLPIPIDRVSPGIFGKVRYDDKIYDHIKNILEFIGNDSSTLVFSPTKNQARKTAINIMGKDCGNPSLANLAEYLGDTIHSNYSLVDCIRCGVAYHHSGVPPHARNAVEKAFTDKSLRVITCTTTLMQGVNLPAKNLIARNPYLSGNRNGPELTPYEFANLRGRAGRLLKDFVGRAIILDENTFDESQIDLFEYPEKEVGTGYSDKFDGHKSDILSSLTKNESVSWDTNKYSDLLSHIRTTILRYGKKAKSRLIKGGIDIPDDTLDSIIADMEKLSIPKEICLKYSHWDPLILDKMFIATKNGQHSVPSSPYDSNFVTTLQENLEFIETNAPTYVKKYLGDISNRKYLYKLLKAAQSWGREQPLKDVISWKDNMCSDEIEDMLSLILTTITYSLPKTLAPYITIVSPESSILAVIESGIHSPLTRKLTEMGLSREIAIRVRSLIDDALPSDEDIESLTEKDLRTLADTILPQLGYWERFQLEDILV